MTQKIFTLLCLGDIVARPGRDLIQKGIPVLRQQYGADFVLANAENSSGGSGLDPKSAAEILGAGVDAMTLGDHAFRRKEVFPYLQNNTHLCIRPANFPGALPGNGFMIIERNNLRIGILNVLGRTFMNGPLDCPFQIAERILREHLADCTLRICDIHAEATSEKIAFARHFDGQFHLIFGTHTHVPTADLKLLPGETVYVTDLGMCGSQSGVIGMKTEAAVRRFLSGLPSPYDAATGDEELHGICVRWELATLRVISFERILFRNENLK